MGLDFIYNRDEFINFQYIISMRGKLQSQMERTAGQSGRRIYALRE